MKKIVLSFLMLCCFAFVGVAQAQVSLEGITVKSDFVSMVANDKANSEIVLLTYVPDDADEVNILGLGGMAFPWGVMFPSSMLSQYAGTQLIAAAFLDCGETDLAARPKAKTWSANRHSRLKALR